MEDKKKGFFKKAGDWGKARLKAYVEAEKKKAEKERVLRAKYSEALKVERAKAFDRAMRSKAKRVAKFEAEARYGKKKKAKSVDMSFSDLTKGMIN